MVLGDGVTAIDWQAVWAVYTHIVRPAYVGVILVFAAFLLAEAAGPVPRSTAVTGQILAGLVLLSYGFIASEDGCIAATVITVPTGLHLVASAFSRASSGKYRSRDKVRWRWNLRSLMGLVLCLLTLWICFGRVD